jgi:hypothetical protein
MRSNLKNDEAKSAPYRFILLVIIGLIRSLLCDLCFALDF